MGLALHIVHAIYIVTAKISVKTNVEKCKFDKQVVSYKPVPRNGMSTKEWNGLDGVLWPVDDYVHFFLTGKCQG